MTNTISLIPKFPERDINGHKGTYGTALLIAGSLGMSGAAALAGIAALKSGAGLVRLLVPASIQSTVASFRPEYTVMPLPADKSGRISRNGLPRILSNLSSTSAVGIGPGLGRSLGLSKIVLNLFTSLPLPAVFDADALNGLSSQESFSTNNKQNDSGIHSKRQLSGARILTPHPGEFYRMSGESISSDPKNRRHIAVRFVRLMHDIYQTNHPIILVLKGAGTVVTDGNNVYINKTGNPGMGTGGAGDVLTGIITALLAQKMDPFDAAVLGVALHGLAGDLAAESKGEISLTAGDIIEFLPEAFKRRKFL